MKKGNFVYQPNDSECEKASNAYLMSLIALMVGLPLPIINLIASGIFYLQNRTGSYFVRWHVTQTLLSQIALLPFNSLGWWWTMSIIFDNFEFSNNYLTYMLILISFNTIEFIATIYSAIQVRKGLQIEWFLLGKLTRKFVSPTLK